MIADPAFALALLGARRHYAVPRILHEAGMLSRFFSDFDASRGWPRLLGRCITPALRPRKLQQLLDRVPAGIPPSSITAFNSLGLSYAIRRALAGTRAGHTRTRLWAGEELSRRALKCGLGRATGVYVFNAAGAELLAAARQRGLLGVVEQTNVPKAIQSRLDSEEAERFPGWAIPDNAGGAEPEMVSKEREEWRLADVILCGSEFVRESIGEAGGPIEKAVVVPYGFDGPVEKVGPPSGPARTELRILLSGDVSFRKGIGDAAAALELVQLGDIRARSAGSINLSARATTSLSETIELLGALPRSAMQDEYDRADVLLHPSIYEGSAMACYEALAAGLPVIATPNAGSVVRDGLDGFIVPARSPRAIAEKLELLSRDRELLRTMSHSARERAKAFSLENYGMRLANAVQEAASLHTAARAKECTP